ncbi:MAG TPA: hypothetical protein VFD39_13130, partial [Trueperaceae bacterium]|nr:hypothetical protein [Trueperaceae bacterium]
MNADVIAQGLSAYRPEAAAVAAGRIMLDRLRQGGHHVPEDVIRRRFRSGLRNLFVVYKEFTDGWVVY